MSVQAAAGRARDHGATLVVAALSSLFASGLIIATGIIAAALDPDMMEASGTMRVVLGMVSLIFIIIALYVGAVVTANTFATIIAGRVRTIALLRLIGSTSARVRRQVAREGLLSGLVGALIGWALAAGANPVLVALGTGAGWLPDGRPYPIFEALTLLPVVVVALTTWAAAWVGSRRVAEVSPMAATGAAVEMTREQSSGRRGRNVTAIVFMALGFAVLALGVLIGMISPLGLFVAFLGGLASFTGIVLGAHLVMPGLLRVVGRLFGTGPTARLAAENAVRFPERSSRSTIGLVIGVTLVVLFAVAMQTYNEMTKRVFESDPMMEAALDQTLSITTGILSGLVGFSAIIAAVGLVNNLSLSVLQRTRELGLLRALGFTGKQVTRMIVIESAQMTIAALGFGLVLGVIYGWAAAQSLIGSQGGFLPPSIPWPILVVVVLGGAALAIAAALGPSRRATRVSPVLALAVD
ncbi:ABC transporter permease [Leucobacter sp. M11]|uniref:ABC transporter permease n=1 Tax=Leucobacter sp. M11 TaxID=2993565 RepID=UPI002D7E75AC|nr:FtsX-like permease family protein [Leucobacter sp. M11]MEB4614215.1 FtsX-like permease family protein [Leucobacter sp. M11]